MKIKNCLLVFVLCLVSSFAHADPKPFTESDVEQSILDTLKVMKAVYVYPDKTAGIESTILSQMAQGAFDGIKTREAFVDRVGGALAEAANDGHMGLMLAEKDKEPTHVLTETIDERKNNFAFQKAEVLPGNVGYVKINKFHPDVAAEQTASHALGFLSLSDALIIDLRDCIGGSPELVKFILSHFYDQPTLLWQYHSRDDTEVHEHHSIAGLGLANGKSQMPIYVLVGPGTASAAELFAYTLQNDNKAEIVGEKTRGIAHAVGAVRINAFFDARFSMSRLTNPHTEKDWENVGIIPDLPVATSDALSAAHEAALAQLKTTHTP